MYIINASIEAIDDQNEIITISNSGVSCTKIDENSGSVTVYTTVTSNANGYYTVHKVPCTVYRNLKKIKVIRGTQMPWKYIRFR